MHLHEGIRKYRQRLIRPFNSGIVKNVFSWSKFASVVGNSVNVVPFESSVSLGGKGLHVDDSFERDWIERSANAASVRETGTTR